jgi:hypothetical protein
MTSINGDTKYPEPISPVPINPATKYIVFSQRVSVRSKASKRRFSHSQASFAIDIKWAVCGQTRVGLTY